MRDYQKKMNLPKAIKVCEDIIERPTRVIVLDAGQVQMLEDSIETLLYAYHNLGSDK